MITINLLQESDLEQDYHFPIDKCLFCDGYDFRCSTYTPTQQEECVWNKLIETDLEKIAKGNLCVTFPDLLKILGRESN